MRYASYFITVVLLGIFISLFFYLFSLNKSPLYSSPIPVFLELKNNKQATFLDFWLPVFETFASTNRVPEIHARSALMYDLVNEKVIYEKNSKTQVPMASLTKIMTAIIALEDKNMPDIYKVNKADLVGEDSMGLELGEILNKEELLYGLMLNSGNDAAEVLARNYTFGRDGFLKAMHDKAKVLGLNNTSFSNPSGLQGDGSQFTTAEDLLKLTRYAIDYFPLFRKIVSTYEYKVSANEYHKEFYLVNETNLLSTYEGVKGVKTGYTPEAGMCLVTYYEKDGFRLIGILLNSPDRRGEMRSLLDFALNN